MFLGLLEEFSPRKVFIFATASFERVRVSRVRYCLVVALAFIAFVICLPIGGSARRAAGGAPGARCGPLAGLLGPALYVFFWPPGVGGLTGGSAAQYSS